MKYKFRGARWDDRSERHVKRRGTASRSDTELAAAVTEAIDCLTTVPLDRVKVRARDGWLHLEGTVNWDRQRTTLEEVTRPLEGVRGVTNSIMIQASPT
jgi:osmotically-inducible protein OsmY